MTYGARLEEAMAYAGLNQPGLAKKVGEILMAEGSTSTITQQTISKALRSGRSAYTSRFARACGVSAEWLEHEIGDMVVKQMDSHSNWPFESIDEHRWRRLRPTDKRKIERIVLSLIEDFEADSGARPKKIKKKQG